MTIVPRRSLVGVGVGVTVAVALLCAGIAPAVVVAGAHSPPEQATAFYVSSASGSDANAGTSASAAFATIQRAQAAVRALRSGPDSGVLPGPVTVFLQGAFPPVSFAPEDSGDATAAVSYVPYPGAAAGTAVITSGTQVPPSAWKQVRPGNTTSGAPALWSAQLPKAMSSQAFLQLWRDEDRLTLARTPVIVYDKATSTVITFKSGDLPSTSPYNVNDITVVTYESWTASVHPVASISASNSTITLATPFNTQWAGGASGKRYYLQGMREALDQVDEWYLDSTSGVLSVLMAPSDDPTKHVFTVPRELELLSAAGNATAGQFVTNVNFKGVVFQHSAVETASCYTGGCDGQSASFLETAAVHLSAAQNWVFDGCTVAHTGGYGMWFDAATSGCAVTNSHLYDLGAGGVRVGPSASGVQPDASLRTYNNVVSDCVLEHGGQWYQEGCGVLAGQVSNVNITHNEIRHFRYTGVSVGWTWGYADTSVHDNLVAYNAIWDIGMGVLSDMGCVYTLGRQPGTQVTHNVCHNVSSFNYGGWGLYTDEGSSDMLYSNNIVYWTKCAGIHQHYGCDNTFDNNVIAVVNYPDSSTGLGALRSSQHPGLCNQSAPNGACSSFTATRNIFYAHGVAVLGRTIPAGLNNMTFSANTYYSDDAAASSAGGFNGTSFAAWQAAGKDATSVFADPMFTNATHQDFGHVAANSPALKEGFQPIDTSNVGPRSEHVGVSRRGWADTLGGAGAWASKRTTR